MSEYNLKNVECEIEFHKVIHGPTILKFEQNYVQDYKIFII